jgi:hypothetical protein
VDPSHSFVDTLRHTHGPLAPLYRFRRLPRVLRVCGRADSLSQTAKVLISLICAGLYELRVYAVLCRFCLNAC